MYIQSTYNVDHMKIYQDLILKFQGDNPLLLPSNHLIYMKQMGRWLSLSCCLLQMICKSQF